MVPPPVVGLASLSRVILVGQAPGDKEPKFGRPFAWTAGKTLFGWFATLGLTEEQFRSRVYMAAVARCFPGKATGGGDRVPSPDEVKRCSRHMETEIRILRPRLVIPVGKLAIAQLYPDLDKLTEIIGEQRRG
ncbi:MAG TPA: uracil-DNA glycosylase family protein, partial [Opitutus sp.]|nr:uracil-DNA glycosylase family protein [Opitutus sp.]